MENTNKRKNDQCGGLKLKEENMLCGQFEDTHTSAETPLNVITL